VEKGRRGEYQKKVGEMFSRLSPRYVARPLKQIQVELNEVARYIERLVETARLSVRRRGHYAGHAHSIRPALWSFVRQAPNCDRRCADAV